MLVTIVMTDKGLFQTDIYTNEGSDGFSKLVRVHFLSNGLFKEKRSLQANANPFLERKLTNRTFAQGHLARNQCQTRLASLDH